MKKALLRTIAWTVAALALVVLIVAVWVARTISRLPDVSLLKHYRPAAASEVLDRNGSVITHFYDRKFRVWVPIGSLPDVVIQAVVTAEDDTFEVERAPTGGALARVATPAFGAVSHTDSGLVGETAYD